MGFKAYMYQNPSPLGVNFSHVSKANTTSKYSCDFYIYFGEGIYSSSDYQSIILSRRIGKEWLCH